MEEQTEIKKNVNVTCYRKYDYENDNTEDVTIALKDIKLGEELFTDYSEFDDCFDEYKDSFF